MTTNYLRFGARLKNSLGNGDTYEIPGNWKESDIWNVDCPEWMALYDTYEHVLAPRITEYSLKDEGR